MPLERVGYKSVATTDGPTLIKSGPSGFYGFVVAAGATVSISVYDGTSTSGTLLYSKAGVVSGDSLHFGGPGIAAKSGLFVTVGGTGSIVNFLYT